MKKVLLFAGLILGLVTINARVDATRECGCQRECWCKQPGLRHFRWVLPFGHEIVSPESKERMESDSLE